MTNIQWIPGPEKVLPEELSCLLREALEDGNHWARFVLYSARLKESILVLISFN